MPFLLHPRFLLLVLILLLGISIAILFMSSVFNALSSSSSASSSLSRASVAAPLHNHPLSSSSDLPLTHSSSWRSAAVLSHRFAVVLQPHALFSIHRRPIGSCMQTPVPWKGERTMANPDDTPPLNGAYGACRKGRDKAEWTNTSMERISS